MVVKRKPINVEEFIERGGAGSLSVPNQGQNLEEEVKGLKLRLPVDLLSEVDVAVKRRRPSPSRHQWILEAIYEKLLRESQQTDASDPSK